MEPHGLLDSIQGIDLVFEFNELPDKEASKPEVQLAIEYAKTIPGLHVASCKDGQLNEELLSINLEHQLGKRICLSLEAEKQ